VELEHHEIEGPVRGTCFHLYVILDIFSRYVVGWMVAEKESAELAEQLIADNAMKAAIMPGMLTLHADRGSSMRSKPVATLLADLGIAKVARPAVHLRRQSVLGGTIQDVEISAGLPSALRLAG
jgi:transposase InsO family protein